VSRNASEPDSASLRTLVQGSDPVLAGTLQTANLPEMAKPVIGGEEQLVAPAGSAGVVEGSARRKIGQEPGRPGTVGGTQPPYG
jgi:hypothetical protein